MGQDVAVVLVRECLPLEQVFSAVRGARPRAEVVVLVSDESALPAVGRAEFGPGTFVSLWAVSEPSDFFRRFVNELSLRATFGAIGITMADHACVSAFVYAERGSVVEQDDSSDDYTDLPYSAVERTLGVALHLTADEQLFFTERLLEGAKGFRLGPGGSVAELVPDDIVALQDGDGAFAKYECVLGL